MAYSIVFDKEKGLERIERIPYSISSRAALKFYRPRPESAFSASKSELLGISLGGFVAFALSLYHLGTGNTAIALIMAGPVLMAVLGWVFIWVAPKLRVS